MKNEVFLKKDVFLIEKEVFCIQEEASFIKKDVSWWTGKGFKQTQTADYC